jgi:hypothetical protein
MRCLSDIPSYAKIESSNINRISEEYNLLHWEVNYKREIENFYLPAGFQKIEKKYSIRQPVDRKTRKLFGDFSFSGK